MWSINTDSVWHLHWTGGWRSMSSNCWPTDWFFSPQRLPSVVVQCVLTRTDLSFFFPLPLLCVVRVAMLQQCWTSWRSSWVTWRPMWRDCPTCCPGSRRCRPACRCLRGASWADSPAGAANLRHSRWDSRTKQRVDRITDRMWSKSDYRNSKLSVFFGLVDASHWFLMRTFLCSCLTTFRSLFHAFSQSSGAKMNIFLTFYVGQIALIHVQVHFLPAELPSFCTKGL